MNEELKIYFDKNKKKYYIKIMQKGKLKVFYLNKMPNKE
jgi:hypothetical protein